MRMQTDEDCPPPTLDEMRGEGKGLIWTLAIVMALLLVGGLWSVARAAESNVYWRVDLNQGTSIIAYGQGATEVAAWQDCFRLRSITRAMTAAETRKSAVSAITAPAVRWCKNPVQLATVAPDPPSGTALLSWTHDGANAIGFRVVYGTSPTALTQTLQVNSATARTASVAGLSSGTWYFALRAFNAYGESDLSNIVQKVIL